MDSTWRFIKPLNHWTIHHEALGVDEWFNKPPFRSWASIYTETQWK
jgi:hypothetical protein